MYIHVLIYIELTLNPEHLLDDVLSVLSYLYAPAEVSVSLSLLDIHMHICI